MERVGKTYVEECRKDIDIDLEEEKLEDIYNK